jgi:hypothetical protein
MNVQSAARLGSKVKGRNVMGHARPLCKVCVDRGVSSFVQDNISMVHI